MAEVRQRLAQLEVPVSTAFRGVVDDALSAYERRVETALTALQQEVAADFATIQRAVDRESRIDQAYRTGSTATSGRWTRGSRMGIMTSKPR